MSWTKRDNKVDKWNVNVQLFMDDFENVVNLEAQMTARDVHLTATPVAELRSAKALEAMTS